MKTRSVVKKCLAVILSIGLQATGLSRSFAVEIFASRPASQSERPAPIPQINYQNRASDADPLALHVSLAMIDRLREFKEAKNPEAGLNRLQGLADKPMAGASVRDQGRIRSAQLVLGHLADPGFAQANKDELESARKLGSDHMFLELRQAAHSLQINEKLKPALRKSIALLEKIKGAAAHSDVVAAQAESSQTYDNAANIKAASQETAAAAVESAQPHVEAALTKAAPETEKSVSKPVERTPAEAIITNTKISVKQDTKARRVALAAAAVIAAIAPAYGTHLVNASYAAKPMEMPLGVALLGALFYLQLPGVIAALKVALSDHRVTLRKVLENGLEAYLYAIMIHIMTFGIMIPFMFIDTWAVINGYHPPIPMGHGGYDIE